MKARSAWLWVLAAAVPATGLAATPWFGVDFGQYALGETLSDKGASGGSWAPRAAETAVTNVAPDVMRLSSEVGVPSVAFAADAAAGESVWQLDFRVKPDSTMAFGDEVDGGCCSVTFVDGETNAVDFAAIVGGRWIRLFAADFAPALGEWYDLRMEVRRMDGGYVAGFGVRRQDVWQPLRSSLGTSWFAVDAATVEQVRRVEISGCCDFSDFDGVKDTSADEAVALHWIGGDAGDWAGPTNWSATAGGEAAGRAPAAGELVKIAGKVRLALGGETGTVSNILARVVGGGGVEFVSGEVLPEVTLDVSRPVADTPLAVTVGTFNGARPEVAVRWYRAGTDRRAFALADAANVYVPKSADYEHWLRCVVTDTAGGELLTSEFFFSKLPVFYLTTDDGQTPTEKKEKHDGRVYVQGNGDWPSQYDGKMEISVRGNSTATQPKKPWKLKLKDKSKMFGIAKSKSWVLLANYLDESNLRNKLAYDFANEIGNLGMQSTWVECVLNGEWQGLYLFGEQIKIDKNRVNVFDWEKEAENHGVEDGDDFSWVDPEKDDITGGYLFEFDWSFDERAKFLVESGNLRLFAMLKSPEYLDTSAPMMAWCESFMQDYADAITSPDGYSGKGLHYSQYCDVESMVRYFLVMEMFGNDDGRYKSIYAYKDRKDKKGREQLMKYGPVWDFDWGVGNYQVAYSPESWVVNHGRNSMYREWADDPWFCTLLWSRYPAVRAKFEEIIRDGGLIDRYYGLLREAGLANEAKWTHHYGFTGGIYGTGSHPGLKAYLRARMAWMDRQFADVPTLMESLKGGASYSKSYYTGTVTVDGRSVNTGDDGNPAQTRPYARETATLPIAFANAPQGGIWEGQDLRLSFAVGGSGVATVGVYANGLKVGEPVAPAGGRLDVTIPGAMLTAAKGEPNCVSLVAFDSSSNATARNYALVTLTDWDDAKDATLPTTDASGAEVPSVPFRWIRDAAVAKLPSLATATAERDFAAALVMTPSPWGKSTPLWRDYVAGTDPDPAGSNATFRITSFAVTNGVPYFTYAPDLGAKRTYTILGKKSLDDSKEGWQCPPPAGARFFRVKVDLPGPLRVRDY